MKARFRDVSSQNQRAHQGAYAFELDFQWSDLGLFSYTHQAHVHMFVDSVSKWCMDQFGLPPADGDWIRFDTGFVFTEQLHASAFKLRWC